MGKRKPTIILLVLDTQRADRMSVYGYHKDTTPALRTLAVHSTVFEWAIAPAPWTIPSHASMFTGLYPSTHQTNQSYSALPLGIPTLAELLRSNGYETVAFCNNVLVGVLESGLKRGFNRFYNYGGTFPDGPDIGEVTIRRRVRNLVNTGMQKMWKPLERQFARSPLLLKLALMPTFGPFLLRLLKFKGDTGRSLHDAAEYLRYHCGTHPEQPLFMFLNVMETHLPYCPPPDLVDKWAPYMKQNREARDFIQRFNTQSYRWMAPLSEPFNETEQRALQDMYDAEVAYQDQLLGTFFRYLEQSGLLENTLLIVTSDHGEAHGDHSLMGHAFALYNEQVHVPLLIRHPELFPHGQRVRHHISSRRIFHTVLEAAGIEHGTQRHNVHELSLRRPTQDAHNELEDEVVVAEAYPARNFLKVVEMNDLKTVESFRMREIRRAIYDGHRKLISVGGQPDELFDVGKDPLETENLLENPASYENDVLQLKNKLDQFALSAEMRGDRPGASTESDLSDDPELRQRLRGLGYFD